MEEERYKGKADKINVSRCVSVINKKYIWISYRYSSISRTSIWKIAFTMIIGIIRTFIFYYKYGSDQSYSYSIFFLFSHVKKFCYNYVRNLSIVSTQVQLRVVSYSFEIWRYTFKKIYFVQLYFLHIKCVIIKISTRYGFVLYIIKAHYLFYSPHLFKPYMKRRRQINLLILDFYNK